MKTAEKLSKYIGAFTTNTHGCSGECHCGIFHYDTANSWDDDHHDNTLPLAEISAVASPDLYQFQDNAISYLGFDDRLYVVWCRCGMDDFIFNQS